MHCEFTSIHYRRNAASKLQTASTGFAAKGAKCDCRAVDISFGSEDIGFMSSVPVNLSKAKEKCLFAQVSYAYWTAS
jgi:hypothetical protein